MKYRRLGASGLEVSVLSFGAWQIGDPVFWATPEQADAALRDEAEATVCAALDAGITLFDTAEMYGAGESERALGRALGARRKDALIAAKVSPENCPPNKLRQSCENTLTRLGTDYIDLYQVHWPPREAPFDDVRGEMERLRDEGKIRAIGVSNFGPRDLDAWMRDASGSCVSDQIGYSLLFRAVEDEVVPACVRHGLVILVYMPLMQGLLTGRWTRVEEIPLMRRRTRHFSCAREGTRHNEPGCEELTLEVLGRVRGIAERLGKPMAEVALAWLLAKPDVSSVIVGAREPGQLKRNLNAVDLELPSEILAELDAASQPLQVRLGANCDMWFGAEQSRIR